MSENQNDVAALPPRPARKKGPLIGLGVVLAAALVAVLVFTTSGGSGGDRVTVRIGTTDASSPYWPTFKEIAAREGIDIVPVNFSDYTQPNPAVSQGQIDLNLFQHLLFLANYNVSNNDSLVPVGSTFVVPLSLYSQKHATVADIPAGGTVAIPNDPTNQARALLVLQSAGLVKLNGGGSVLSTPAEIDAAASKVSVTPVDAAQTVTALPSVDASIVNNNYALNGGLDPSKALFGDDPASPSAEPYINVIATRAADRDNPVYQRVAQLYKDSAVVAQVQAESKGTSVMVDRPRSDLDAILARLSETVRAGRR
ncbi:MetQ/NlpA family ABC transporter substrate-binding protein [Saccharopolyspora taberi]|uniref:MetQ/NlpA family ABC transporter substrate-binding protein n=1 Tax=Saccharopolyspora taberi TaxID=60895 RepID=A0ABN3VE87_9PSEU